MRPQSCSFVRVRCARAGSRCRGGARPGGRSRRRAGECRCAARRAGDGVASWSSNRGEARSRRASVRAIDRAVRPRASRSGRCARARGLGTRCGSRGWRRARGAVERVCAPARERVRRNDCAERDAAADGPRAGVHACRRGAPRSSSERRAAAGGDGARLSPRNAERASRASRAPRPPPSPSPSPAADARRPRRADASPTPTAVPTRRSGRAGRPA